MNLRMAIVIAALTVLDVAVILLVARLDRRKRYRWDCDPDWPRG